MYSESILGKKRTGSVKGFILGIATLLFLCLGVSSGFAQDISSQLKKIKELQARAAYDSARMLANFILSQPRLSTEDKQKILLSKQFSFYYLGKYDSLRAGLPILEKEIEEEHELYSELLLVRGLQKGEDGLYVAAIQDLLEAEKRVLAQKEQGVLGTIYNSLAGNFKDLEDYQKAKYYYRKAQDLFNQQGNTQSLVMVYNNVGGIYRKENLLDSALYVYDAASALLAELNNPFLLAQNTLNMGNVYEQKGDLKEAEAAFLRCLQLSESSKLQYGVLLSTLNLGNLYR
jgi:tetratricopeptide (TPR) repeat protein